MTAKPSAADLLARNAEYAKTHKALPTIAELRVPKLTTAILSCVDPRVHPESILKLQPKESLVIRNVGGRVNEASLRDLLTVDSTIGHSICELMILHHTDCGASHFTSEDIRADYRARHPEYSAEISDWYTGSFEGQSDVETLKADVEAVKKNKFVSDAIKDNVHGFIFDIKTGLLSEV